MGYAVQSIGDVLYGANYGIKGDGTTDNTAAFNAFMAACKASSKKGELPLGVIRLASKPNDIDFAWDLGGKGKLSTVLLRDYTQAGSTIGVLALIDGANGTRIHNLSVQSNTGTSGGVLISGICSSSSAIGSVTLENLYLTTTGTDTHVSVLNFDGSLRTASPIGFRGLSLKNVDCFGAVGYSVILKSVIGCSWNGGGIYPAGGTGVASGGLQITGTASVKSQYVSINLETSGGVNLTQCLDMKLDITSIGTISGLSVANDNTCSFTQVIGHNSGTVTGNWVSSGIRRTSAAFATSA